MNFTILCKAVGIPRYAKSKMTLVMQWTAVFLLGCCLQVAAASTAQKVTLSENKIPLKKVLSLIKKQTGLTFFFNEGLVEKAKPVTLNVTNMPLEQALDQCFRDQPLSYQIVNKTIVISKRAEEPAAVFNTPPPPVKITGTITDETTGLPVEGATVLVKGTRQSAITGSNGSFTLETNPGATLVITMVGYTSREIPVNNQATLSFTLTRKADPPLEEVVITGFQRIRKESFTGTAITVSGEELKKINPQNILQSIQVFDPSFRIVQNNIAGSNPNRLPVINVRGNTAVPTGANGVLSRSNLSGNTNLPTFILDGYEVSLEKVYDLDINRVQTITLLKDAAATAVYGSRAANGVLVITTIPPKEGKLQLSYNYELNPTAPDLSAYKVLNAADKLEYERLAGLYDATVNGGALNQNQLDELYYAKKENVLAGVNTYWLSQPLRTGYGQKHSAYIEGGSKAIRYGVELRYHTMPGVMKGSGRNRYSAGMNLSYNAGSKLLFKNTLTATQVNSTESPYGQFSDYVKTNPYYQKTDSAGNITREMETWLRRTGAANNIETYRVLNPMYDATLSSFTKSSYLEFIDAFSAEWNISSAIRIRGQVSLNKTTATNDIFKSPLANEFYNYKTADYRLRGRYYYGISDFTSVDGNLLFTYNKQIGSHFINVSAGGNFRTNGSNNKSFTAVGFTNDRFPNLAYAGGYPEGSTPQASFPKERLAGVLASANYTYANKYLLDLSYRLDGSSNFGKDQRMAPFAAVGIGWNMHKESFFRYKFISQLKLRAGTGVTGSVSFPPFMGATTYTYYTNQWYATGIGAVVSNIGNSNLRWQKTENLDLGADIGLWNDRVTASLKYYYKYTTGLLTSIMLAPSTGSLGKMDNLGDMENKGWEVNLKAVVFKNKDWNISVFTNLTGNKNKIVKISNSLKRYNDQADQAQDSVAYKGVPLLRYNEGQSTDAIYAVRSLGIDPETGKEIFVKRNGQQTYDWSVTDIQPIVDATPKLYGYFGPSLAFKQFSFAATFYTRLGGYDYNQTLVDRIENADPRYNVDQRVFDQRWKKPGDHTLYKNIADIGQTQTTSRFIQKDNVVELTSVFASYDFVPAMVKKWGMQSLRLAVTMNDLWRTGSIVQERGLDYPFARSFTFSVQTRF